MLVIQICDVFNFLWVVGCSDIASTDEWVCSTCQLELMNKIRLVSHIIKKHIKTFMCKICTKVCSGHTNLVQHYKNIHRQPSPDITSYIRDGRVRCRDCNKHLTVHNELHICQPMVPPTDTSTNVHTEGHAWLQASQTQAPSGDSIIHSEVHEWLRVSWTQCQTPPADTNTEDANIHSTEDNIIKINIISDMCQHWWKLCTCM